VDQGNGPGYVTEGRSSMPLWLLSLLPLRCAPVWLLGLAGSPRIFIGAGPGLGDRLLRRPGYYGGRGFMAGRMVGRYYGGGGVFPAENVVTYAVVHRLQRWPLASAGRSSGARTQVQWPDVPTVVVDTASVAADVATCGGTLLQRWRPWSGGTWWRPWWWTQVIASRTETLAPTAPVSAASFYATHFRKPQG